MASLNSRPLPAGLAAQQQGAAMVAAPPSPRGGAPGFAVVPQGAAPAAAPASPQGPPGFWVAPQQSAPAPSPLALGLQALEVRLGWEKRDGWVRGNMDIFDPGSQLSELLHH